MLEASKLHRAEQRRKETELTKVAGTGYSQRDRESWFYTRAQETKQTLISNTEKTEILVSAILT